MLYGGSQRSQARFQYKSQEQGDAGPDYTGNYVQQAPENQINVYG